MELKIKYNLGDKVFFMHENRVYTDVIKKVTFSVEKLDLNNYEPRIYCKLYFSIGYHDTDLEVYLDDAYATKEELLAAL